MLVVFVVKLLWLCHDNPLGVVIGNQLVNGPAVGAHIMIMCYLHGNVL